MVGYRRGSTVEIMQHTLDRTTDAREALHNRLHDIAICSDAPLHVGTVLSNLLYSAAVTNAMTSNS